MGETAAKPRQVFDATGRTAVSISLTSLTRSAPSAGWPTTRERSYASSTGFLQVYEQNRSHSLVVAATNRTDLLDLALFRHFDDVLQYNQPDQKHIVRLLKLRLSTHTSK